MLKRLLHCTFIATAVAAAQVQASEGIPGYLGTASAEPVVSGHGACWRTAEWTPAHLGICVERSTYSAEVLFDFEHAELSAQGRKRLDDLAQALLAVGPERVVLTAHADRIGGADYNERLAARRAQAIRAYLVETGVPEKLLQVESKGAREPLTAGRCDAMGPLDRQNAKLIACLQPDRRVEIEVAVRRVLP